MPFFNSRRSLTALTLATLLSASPVLGQGRPQARTARATRPVGTASQPGLLNLLQDTLSRLIASAVTTPPSGKSAGGDAGVRIDPEGASAPPSPGTTLGLP